MLSRNYVKLFPGTCNLTYMTITHIQTHFDDLLTNHRLSYHYIRILCIFILSDNIYLPCSETWLIRLWLSSVLRHRNFVAMSSNSQAQQRNYSKYNLIQHKVRDIFAILFILQAASSVEKNTFVRLNVTRQSDGDILAFKKKVDCSSFNAECFCDSRRVSQRNMCDTCKCLSIYTTYVSVEKQCININGITGLNCRTSQRQMPMLKKSIGEISQPTQAYHCKIPRGKRKPEYHPNRGNISSWSWRRMRNVNFSLTGFENDSKKFWQVTFNKSSVSKMQTKYAAKVVKLEISCRMGQNTGYNTRMCIIFKISGSFKRKHPYRPDFSNLNNTGVITPTISHNNYTLSTEKHEYYTSVQSDNDNTAGNRSRKSGKDNPVTWYIVTIPVIVTVIMLVVLLSFILYKRRKRSHSNTEQPERNNAPNEYDTPMIATTHCQVHGNDQNGEEHVYETCLKPKNDNPYQDLNPNDREKSSQYQALIKPPQAV